MDKCTNGGNGMNKEKREWLTSLRLVIIIITIAITVRTIFFSPIIVDGPSMLPTLESQDQMIINKFVYRLKEPERLDRKSTRLNSSHVAISYAVFCLKKKIINSSTRRCHNDSILTHGYT